MSENRISGASHTFPIVFSALTNLHLTWVHSTHSLTIVPRNYSLLALHKCLPHKGMARRWSAQASWKAYTSTAFPRCGRWTVRATCCSLPPFVNEGRVRTEGVVRYFTDVARLILGEQAKGHSKKWQRCLELMVSFFLQLRARLIVEVKYEIKRVT